MTASDWNCVENVLCIRLDTIGDVLMTTPAIRALKSHPSRRIAADFLCWCCFTGPEIDEVIVYDAPG